MKKYLNVSLPSWKSLMSRDERYFNGSIGEYESDLLNREKIESTYQVQCPHCNKITNHLSMGLCTRITCIWCEHDAMLSLTNDEEQCKACSRRLECIQIPRVVIYKSWSVNWKPKVFDSHG